MRHTEMQGEGTAALLAPGGRLDALNIELTINKAPILAPMPPYELLSKRLANIYERGISRIPTMPSIGAPPSAAARKFRQTVTRTRKGR